MERETSRAKFTRKPTGVGHVDLQRAKDKQEGTERQTNQRQLSFNSSIFNISIKDTKEDALLMSPLFSESSTPIRDHPCSITPVNTNKYHQQPLKL